MANGNNGSITSKFVIAERIINTILGLSTVKLVIVLTFVFLVWRGGEYLMIVANKAEDVVEIAKRNDKRLKRIENHLGIDADNSPGD